MEALLQIIKIKKHDVRFHKVKGHATTPNNRCAFGQGRHQGVRRMNGEEEAAGEAGPAEQPAAAQGK